jgi:hypothetical protein
VAKDFSTLCNASSIKLPRALRDRQCFSTNEPDNNRKAIPAQIDTIAASSQGVRAEPKQAHRTLILNGGM